MESTLNYRINSFNQTSRKYPKNDSLSSLFEQQASLYPNKKAVVMENESLSYNELNLKANQYAGYLSDKMIDATSNNIAVVMDSSIHYIISILSILKAGYTYVPIDPQYPAERIKYILEKCKAKLVITEQKYNPIFQVLESNVEVVEIDGYLFSPDATTYEFNSSKYQNDLAYIMFTSGTTGEPKGVMIQHKNVIKLVVNTTYISFTNNDRVLQAGAIVFDASTFEIWGVLLNGGTLYLINKENLLNVKKMHEFIYQNQISIICLTTPLFAQIVQINPKIFETVETLIVGGDVLLERHAHALLENCKNINFYNGYGPTECTTFATVAKISLNGIINIGRPIDNTNIYILDENKGLLDIGEIGEVYIGGEGVGIGYLDDQILTDKHFVDNPHNSGEIIYKTGDLGRWNPDGSVEYLGRIDNQIKIRGHRVELSEIEATINKLSEVDEVVIFHTKNEDGHYDIYAFYVSKTMNESAIKKHIVDNIPKYMHPNHVKRISKIPLNINGKVDKYQLLSQIPRNIIEKNLDNSGGLEKEILEIWMNVLKTKEINNTDDFFEIGGHSLAAVKLMSDLQNKYSIDIPLNVIYKYSTVEKLSVYIEGEINTVTLEKGTFNQEKKQVCSKLVQATDAQKRMFTINHYENIDLAYNVIIGLELSGNLNEEKLHNSLKAVVRKHEILRTIFKFEEGEVYQEVSDTVDVTLSIFRDLSPDSVQEAMQKFVQKFNLSTPPLFQFGLFQLSQQNYIFIINVHHIILDRVSIDIFLKDTFQIYQQGDFENSALQFADYCISFEELVKNSNFNKSKEFWAKELKGELPKLDIPSDYNRPSVQTFEGERLLFALPENNLDQHIMKMGVTKFTFFTAVLNILLMKYSGNEDIIIGSPVTARLDEKFNRTLGLFVNTVAIRNYPKSNLRFSEFLNQVKTTIVGAIENQFYPFERILKDINLERDISRNPLFNVMILLNDEVDYSQFETQELSFKPFNIERKTSKYDFTLKIHKDKLEFEYCTSIFSHHNIENMARYLLNIIDQVVKNSNIRIANINMLSKDETKYLIETLNTPKINAIENADVLTLKEIFEKRVEETPDAIAINDLGYTVTYLDLNREANQLAHFLIESGVGPDVQVGVLLDSSYYMVLGILAVFKAGGAFVPIDPETPESRVRHIFDDSGMAILLTTRKYLTLSQKLWTTNLTCVLDEFKDNYSNRYSFKNPTIAIDSNNLAYMIYTSGTTGVPKGVLVKQKSLVNYLCWFKDQGRITESDETILLSSFSFDLGYTVLFSSLFFGGTLHLLKKQSYLNPPELLNYFKNNSIKFIKVTPTFFSLLCQEELLNKLKNKIQLELIVLGGEVINVKDLQLFNSYFPDVKFINHYGPTEATIGSIAYCINDLNDLNDLKANSIIGRPISNTEVFILNKDGQPVPIGIPGEIHISGIGLSPGYYNNSELTDQRFIYLQDFGGKRVYKTGDYGKYLTNGKIAYLGRKDQQIKFKGYRIELSEIEKKINTIPGVQHVVVVLSRGAFNTNEYQQLTAYLVTSEDLKPEDIQRNLRNHLPEYMIPAGFVFLDSLPINTNGKLDFGKLPPVEFEHLQLDQEISYKTRDEEEIVSLLFDVWAKTLGHQDFDVDDNFFEIGGSSLLLIKVHEELSNVQSLKLKLTDMFNYPNISKLANYIHDTQGGYYE